MPALVLQGCFVHSDHPLQHSFCFSEKEDISALELHYVTRCVTYFNCYCLSAVSGPALLVSCSVLAPLLVPVSDVTTNRLQSAMVSQHNKQNVKRMLMSQLLSRRTRGDQCTRTPLCYLASVWPCWSWLKKRMVPTPLAMLAVQTFAISKMSFTFRKISPVFV